LFAPLKKASTDFLVEKAVEMGVAELRPVLTERTGARDVRTDRLARIAIEAAEQTERLDVPPVRDAEKLARAFDEWDEARPVYYADESGVEGDRPWGGSTGRAPPMAEVIRKTPPSRAAILIGPEGGFSPMERAWLRSLPFVRPVGLGPRILRAETAATAALALYQALAGDWR
jgi:16S rRNA (uracil1498-N3)-methyltransferase